jgi:hypothetical protein
MTLRNPIAWALCCAVGLIALPCVAAPSATPPAPPATSAPADSPNASKDAKHTIALGEPRKSHRLKFRGPDGTCACDCASGGITEADIRKAEAAHKSASR